ncbi:MAG: phytanoyl-CoA dioxygenase family protein [Candidatus Latescibacteria bacterium]|jgi:phytanoyl-CoA hydroxylase|nr:phytanoyl-CoA dioxygenase [Gemmatimonadaceae bacterium]MDP6017670.1 phytanoyl-CoA dioxygenase family protein [Candidatus Latescibacterota bacterium]
MITEQQKADFDRDGFVLLRGYLSPEEATEVNANIDRFIEAVLPQAPDNTAFYEDPKEPSSIKRLQNMHHLDRWFGDLFGSDRIQGLAGILLGDGVRGKNVQWFNKPARVGGVTPPHQDGFYFMLEPNEAITLWLALDDIDEENGCIRYVRGTHREGMRPHQRSDVVGFSQGLPDYSDEDMGREEPIRARPGDLFAHHSMTVHRADANPSPRRRAALGFVYFAESAREDAERAERYRQELYAQWEAAGRL